MKRTTLVALAVFVGLLLLVFVSREEQVSVGVKELSLPALKKDAVTALEVSGPASAKLEKTQDGWRVGGRPADERQIDTALDALLELKAKDFVTERTERLAELELDDAKGLKLQVTGGPGLALVFGKSSSQGGVYVRKADSNEVYLTQSRLPWLIKKDAGLWRKRSVLAVKAADVASVSVTHPDGVTVKLEAKEPGPFSLSEPAPPAGFRYDAQAAQRLVDTFSALSAQDFFDGPDDGRLGLSGPHTTVRAVMRDGKEHVLHLGQAADPRAVGAASGLSSGFDAVDGLGTKDGKITRDELAAASTKSDSPTVKDAAAVLVREEAIFNALDGGGYGEGSRDGVITQAELTAATRTLGLVPARLDGDSQTYLLPSYAAAGLTKRLDDLRDLTLLAFEPEKVTRVLVQSKGKRAVVEKKDGAWTLVEPTQMPAGQQFDPDQVSTFVSSLRSLRALRVLPDVTSAKAGLQKPVTQIDLTLEGGPKYQVRYGGELDAPGGGKDVYVQGAVDELIYAASPGDRARFDSGVELFKHVEPPPNAGINGLDSLPPDVRRQLEAQLRQQGIR